MRIALVGNGNLAWHLNAAIRESNSRIDLHVVRNLPVSSPWKTSTQLSDINDSFHLVLLAIPDSQIAEVAAQLPEKVIAVHFSGGSSIFTLPQKNRAVCWPCQTLKKGTSMKYNNIPLLYECSNSETETIVKAFLQPVIGNWISANGEQRQLAHISAVFSNNFTNHLQYISQSLLKEAQLPTDLFYTMLKAHIELLETKAPESIQTGPAQRGDVGIIESQKQILNNHADWKEIYALLSQSILEKYQ
ncbi:MAG: hypothetical protein RLZZ155_1692 [Bacteroidota bacterium]|jgi:predicted short-subunit dehydrogenase-like oxidoreductase (DUF2520 family)